MVPTWCLAAGAVGSAALVAVLAVEGAGYVACSTASQLPWF